MTTFDDDFIRFIDGNGHSVVIRLVAMDLEWPPPVECMLVRDDDSPPLLFRRERMSQLTDSERAKMTHVCRGAEYVPVPAPADPLDGV